MRFTRAQWRTVVQGLLLTAAVIAIMTAFSTHDSGAIAGASNRQAMRDFQLPTLDGGSWSLGAQRGRVVLLNFWATWCPPCRMETPELVAIARRYQPQGLSIVGISMDDDPAAAAPAFVAKYGIPYPIAKPTPNFAPAEAIESLPTTILLDRDGRVARTFFGAVTARQLSGDIERLLNETTAAR